MTGLLSFIQAACASDHKNYDVVHLDSVTIRWAVHVGLGPFVSHTCRRLLVNIDGPKSEDMLRSADLVAKVGMSDALDSLEELLAASADLASEIILLKGISTCQYLYSEPYLRTIGDIDLLISVQRRQQLETLLVDLGYRQQSSRPAEFYKKHHHSMPFVHPTKHIWLEVHTALLSDQSVALDRVFSSSHIQTQVVPMLFRGHKTNRLTYEQELVYIATHWGLERKCFAGGVIPLIDMIYLIQKHGHELDWNHIVVSLEGSQAAVYVNLMLSFLQKHGLIFLPATVMKRLTSAQKYLLGLNEFILHKLIDNYSIRGRHLGRITTETNLSNVWKTLLRPRAAWRNFLKLPWNILFAPENPRRFSPSFQFTRIFRLLRSRKQ